MGGRFMKSYAIFVVMKVLQVICLFLLCSCGNEQPKETAVVAEQSNAAVYSFITLDYQGLETHLENSKAQITVVNFWATWCKPCIKELPYFEEVQAKYKESNLEVILVSLDFPDQKERLEKFIEDRNITSEVVLLDDPDANSWIDKVDKSWSGAIPATMIYNDKKRSFYERSFTFQELEEELEKFKQ